MPSGHWGGDLNAAKEFHSQVQHRALDNGRRGRGPPAHGGRRGGSNVARGGRSLANTSSASKGNGGRNLATAPPSYLWEPAKSHGIQDTRAVVAEDHGDPMNIDEHGLGSSQWASAPRTAAGSSSSAQNGTGSVTSPASQDTTVRPATTPSGPTPAMCGITNSFWGGIPPRAPSDLVRTSAPEPSDPTAVARGRPASPVRGLGISAHHATVNNNTNSPRAADHDAESPSVTREQVTWGPSNTPVRSIQPFHSPTRAIVSDKHTTSFQNDKTSLQATTDAGQGAASATDADRPWPGLKASCHAGSAGQSGPTSHRQDGGLRRDLLQDNGMLTGVQFSEDQGPEQDDDWLKTYNLNKIKDKCLSVANDAITAGDHEAEKALRKVIVACDDVLRAKNRLRDKRLTGEADKVLSKSQHEAWRHWIKFYHPVPPNAGAVAPKQAHNEIPNVQMQDAPAIACRQVKQVQDPRVPDLVQPEPHVYVDTVVTSAFAQAPATHQRPRLGGTDSGGFESTSLQQRPTDIAQYGGFDYTPSDGFSSEASQNMAQKAQDAPDRSTCTAQFDGNTPLGGFGAANPQLANAQQTEATSQQPQLGRQLQGTQPTTELTDLPSMFPQGLPAAFDDPQARQIFEDFFFQNKRLTRK